MSEKGAVHLTLLALLFGGVVMLGLAVDMTRIATAVREATHLAAAAAEEGAGWIDEEAARDDRIRVDRPLARQAARRVASGTDRVVDVRASREAVCVSVSIRVRPTLLAIVGADPKTVTATSCSEPRKG